MVVRKERYELPCGSRDCDHCGRRWEQDQRVRAVAAAEQLTGSVALITITAPGASHFGWGPPGSFDSPREQKIDWNRSARRRWRRLHLAASRPVRELARAFGATWRLLYRSWEYQKRGLLHVHLVLPYDGDVEQALTELYVSRLWSMARKHHFGYVLGGGKGDKPGWTAPPPIPPASGDEVARYVCKYVASIGSGKDSMSSVAKRTGKRGSILYVSNTLTQLSGVTMTSLRARRRIHSRHPWARESREAWRVACHIDALQRGVSPLDAVSEDEVRALLLRRRGLRLLIGATGELVAPTLAPPPLCAVEDRPPGEPVREAAVAVLASVWLGDPQRPELGPVRTRVSLWEPFEIGGAPIT